MKIRWNNIARRKIGFGLTYGNKDLTIAVWFGTVIISL